MLNLLKSTGRLNIPQHLRRCSAGSGVGKCSGGSSGGKSGGGGGSGKSGGGGGGGKSGGGNKKVPVPPKLLKLQKLFQKKSDLPVFLRGGQTDVILYYTTLGLTGLGLIMDFAFYASYILP